MDEGQFLGERDFLHAPDAEGGRLGQRAGLDAAVVDRNGAAHAADEADAGDRVAAGQRFLLVRRIEQVTRHVAHDEERHARVEQASEALARGELVALDEARLARLGADRAAPVELLHPADERQHIGAVGLEAFAGRVDLAAEHGHAARASASAAACAASAAGTGIGVSSKICA